LRIGRPDAATVGALMMHFMLETILTAHLLAVDPFDQPAVEEGKVLARRALAAMGAMRGGTP
jgi:glucose-6-phosphate isomerase